MNCELCFQYEDVVQMIDIGSDEAQHLKIPSILHQHFRFCFPVPPDAGRICRCCWSKVSIFHEFYTSVEDMYRTEHKVFVECIHVAAECENDLNSTTIETVKCETMDPEPFNAMIVDHLSSEAPHVIVNAQRLDLKAKPAKKKLKLKTESSDTFQCKVCEMHFLSLNSLERHIKQSHDVKEFKCQHMFCVESFDTRQSLDEHFTANHSRSECPYCKKMILDAYYMQHVRDKHEEEKRGIVCELCGKISLNKHRHTIHFQTAHGETEKLQCDICGQWYKNKESIRAHLKRHVRGPQTCEICGKISPNHKALSQHRMSHKPGAKDRFKCVICGKGFSERVRLEEHSDIHTGSAGRYHCGVCDRYFRYASSFSLHKKKSHPKIII